MHRWIKKIFWIFGGLSVGLILNALYGWGDEQLGILLGIQSMPDMVKFLIKWKTEIVALVPIGVLVYYKYEIYRKNKKAIDVKHDATKDNYIFDNGNLRLCRISVQNISENTIRNIKVKLGTIDPPQPALHLPIGLHIRHDIQIPNRDSFNLPSGDSEYIDVVQTLRHPNNSPAGFEICHIVDGIQRVIPFGIYGIVISITSDDLPMTFEKVLNFGRTESQLVLDLWE